MCTISISYIRTTLWSESETYRSYIDFPHILQKTHHTYFLNKNCIHNIQLLLSVDGQHQILTGALNPPKTFCKWCWGSEISWPWRWLQVCSRPSGTFWRQKGPSVTANPWNVHPVHPPRAVWMPCCVTQALLLSHTMLFCGCRDTGCWAGCCQAAQSDTGELRAGLKGGLFALLFEALGYQVQIFTFKNCTNKTSSCGFLFYFFVSVNFRWILAPVSPDSGYSSAHAEATYEEDWEVFDP